MPCRTRSMRSMTRVCRLRQRIAMTMMWECRSTKASSRVPMSIKQQSEQCMPPTSRSLSQPRASRSVATVRGLTEEERPMRTKTKFDERKRLNEFGRDEARAALNLLADVEGERNATCLDVGG